MVVLRARCGGYLAPYQQMDTMVSNSVFTGFGIRIGMRMWMGKRKRKRNRKTKTKTKTKKNMKTMTTNSWNGLDYA